MTQDAVKENIRHLILERGNRDDLAPFVLVAIPVNQWKQLRLVFQLVDLVQQKQRGFFGTLDEVEDEAIAVSSRRRRVANQCNEIDAEQCILDGSHHPAVQFVTGLMHTWCVDEHDLALRFRQASMNAKASGLWFIGDGSDLLTDQSIQQS